MIGVIVLSIIFEAEDAYYEAIMYAVLFLVSIVIGVFRFKREEKIHPSELEFMDKILKKRINEAMNFDTEN